MAMDKLDLLWTCQDRDVYCPVGVNIEGNETHLPNLRQGRFLCAVLSRQLEHENDFGKLRAVFAVDQDVSEPCALRQMTWSIQISSNNS
jgi:hypothetical protein